MENIKSLRKIINTRFVIPTEMRKILKLEYNDYLLSILDIDNKQIIIKKVNDLKEIKNENINKLDYTGRYVIPFRIRKKIELKNYDYIIVTLDIDNQQLIIKKLDKLENQFFSELRQIDFLGKISIPHDIREFLKIKPQDFLITTLDVDNKQIIIKKMDKK